MEVSEELIKTWNQISYALKPSRMFSKLSYNEQTICSILIHSEKNCTATDLIQKTGLLKSQMNKIISQLEEKNVIQRNRNLEDKRKITIFITDFGKELYQKEHQSVLEIGKHVTNSLGEEKTRQLVDLMNETLHIIEKGEENEY
ncbi:MAG: MarR family winged helix-turn-helix transcriptional regulator [Erysipelotrichaceae bacterium]|nr:MarR family winged helix-turn-helix transcriptional regulator [Erysipelotrichaceae bacterium]